MNITLPLDKMSTAEKIQTMETLWDDLCHHAQDITIPDWHYELLAARDAGVREGTDTFADWESAKDAIRESVK